MAAPGKWTKQILAVLETAGRPLTSIEISAAVTGAERPPHPDWDSIGVGVRNAERSGMLEKRPNDRPRPEGMRGSQGQWLYSIPVRKEITPLEQLLRDARDFITSRADFDPQDCGELVERLDLEIERMQVARCG